MALSTTGRLISAARGESTSELVSVTAEVRGRNISGFKSTAATDTLIAACKTVSYTYDSVFFEII